VSSRDRADFRHRIVPVVCQRHETKRFDLFESPEIGAEGSAVALAFPEIARVVKLHTPSYLLDRFGYELPTVGERLRFSLGALRRGRVDFLKRKSWHFASDPERAFASAADEIVAPSTDIGAIVKKDWDLPKERISHFLYPFYPSRELFALPPAVEIKRVSFLGRLESRKGIVELARAIPSILEQAPGLRFRFLGPSWPFKRIDMKSWMLGLLSRYRDSLEFAGAVSPAELPEHLAQCDVMVLPSRWESVGYACIESLASARAVIGSEAGGMAEMIEHGKTGLLVPPRNPKAIAEAVLSLVGRPQLVRQFAEAGRKAIVEKLAPERILPLQLASYERAIGQCRRRHGLL
jgi:glycosyltransferase involved in cell wall biosynthesis